MSSSMSLQKQPQQPLKRSSHIKRYLTGYVTLLALVAGCLYAFWLDGKIYKQKFYQQIDAIKNDSRYNVDVIEYHQGWFHSSAKIFVTIPTINSGMLIEQTITHGPLVKDPIKNQHTIAAAAINSMVYMTNLQNHSDSKNEIATIHSLATFNNLFLNRITTDLINQKTNHFIAKKIICDFSYKINSDHLDKIHLVLSVESISLKTPIISLDISGLKADSDMVYNPIELWTGTQNFSINSFSIFKTEKFNASNINYQSSFQVDQKNHYNYKIQQSFKQLNLPNITITPMQFNLSIVGMNAPALRKFIIASQTMKKTAPQQIINNYNQLFMNLFTTDTLLNFSLNAGTTYGEIRLAGNVNWLKDNKLPTSLIDLKDYSHLTAHFTIPVVLVDYLVAIYTKKNQPEDAVAEPAKPVEPSYQAFEDQITQLADNNTISVSTKTRLIGFVEQQIAVEAFSAYIDQLVTINTINSETADILKKQYELAKKAEDNPEKNSPLATSVKPEVPVIKERIIGYKNMGYIIEENGNYIINITLENGQLKLNNKQLLPLSTEQQ